MKKSKRIFFFVFVILLINFILKFFLGDVKCFYIENLTLWLVLIVSSLIGFFLYSYSLKIRFLIRFSFLVICFILGSISNFSIDLIDAFHSLLFTSNTIYIIWCQSFSVESENNVVYFTTSLSIYVLSNWVLYFLVYKLVGNISNLADRNRQSRKKQQKHF